MSRIAISVFNNILPEEKRSEFNKAYKLCEKALENYSENYRSSKSCYYLCESSDIEKITDIYRNAVWSAVLLVRNIDGSKEYDYDKLVSKVSMNSLYVLSRRIQLTEKEKAENYRQAEITGSAVKIQVATMLMHYICEDAGIDCDSIQKSYIKSKTVEMIILVVFQAICAVVSAYEISLFSAKAEEEIRKNILEKHSDFLKGNCLSLPRPISAMFFRMVFSRLV